jgi:hypothetical protein
MVTAPATVPNLDPVVDLIVALLPLGRHSSASG